MASNSKQTREVHNAPVRFDQFKKQLDEAGISQLQEIVLDENTSIWIRLGNSVDASDAQEFEERLEEAGNEGAEELCMVILDYYEGATAQEQWNLFTAAGGTAEHLTVMFSNLSREQAERLGKIKLRRSAGRKK